MSLSLDRQFPKYIERYWDFEKNKSLPCAITVGQREWVFFVCENGHEFSSRPSRMKRVSLEKFCIECLSLGFNLPDLIKHYSPKNKKSAWEMPVSGGSGVFLICSEGHEFKVTGIVSSEQALGKCEKCKYLKESLSSLYPDRAQLWNYEKNDTTPNKLLSGDKSKKHFICEKGHSFTRNPWAKVTKLFCPYCSNPSLRDVFPEIVEKYWDFAKNQEDPNVIASNSSGRFMFTCPEGHSFDRGLGSIKNQSREFCPECRLNKYSFAAVYPKGAQLWDYEKNNVTPNEVMAGTGGGFYFICDFGHSINQQLRNMEDGVCAICYSQESELERSVRTFLYENNFGANETNSRKLIAPFEIDVYWKNLHKALEVNGDFWHSDDMVKAKTNFKSSDDYHLNKVRLAKAVNVDLTFVWGHDWTTHEEEVKRELLRWLGGGRISKDSIIRKIRGAIDEPCELCQLK